MPRRNKSIDSGLVRKRISRACDQCNQLRTKCNGQYPCNHCIDFSLQCEYARACKKRGKASKKDLVQESGLKHSSANVHKSTVIYRHSRNSSLNSTEQSASHLSLNESSTPKTELSFTDSEPLERGVDVQPQVEENRLAGARGEHFPQNGQPIERSVFSGGLGSQLLIASPITRDHGFPVGLDEAVGLDFTPGSGKLSWDDCNNHNFLAGYSRVPPPGHPFSFQYESSQSPTTPAEIYPGVASVFPQEIYPFSSPMLPPLGESALQYPVLRPIISYLVDIMPYHVAYELLESYFAAVSPTQMQGSSPYILCSIFREQSFLHPSTPRSCSNALTTSILWISAQSSNSMFLRSSCMVRETVCNKLLELTIRFLRPASQTLTEPFRLREQPFFINGVDLSDPGTCPLDPAQYQAGKTHGQAYHQAATLDDVVTYIHIATVISASEHKRSSLKWWDAAWTLARRLKLDYELPLGTSTEATRIVSTHIGSGFSIPQTSLDTMAREEVEERRRVFWLLYTVDKHLSLSYNKLPFFPKRGGEAIFQPLEDEVWLSKNSFYGPLTSLTPRMQRQRGHPYLFASSSIFGYLTPLMTILADVLEYNHTSHSHYNKGFKSSEQLLHKGKQIVGRLEAYEQSLETFKSKNSSKRFPDTAPPEDSRSRIALAYSSYIVQVLFVLLKSKWDPIDLLEDADLWISSPSFVSATSHAIAAAESLSTIMLCDPGMEFMPFFFGTYLIQGSLLLLLIADKLEGDVSVRIVKACELVIRATESCLATLPTQYQRDFRKVMMSALAQATGQVDDDLGSLQARRREILGLYRWAPGGHGIGL